MAEVLESEGNILPKLIDGWYVIRGAFDCDGRVEIDGDVYLILEDDCDVTIIGGIQVNAGDSLMIYAQSVGVNMGKLFADASSVVGGAGIGGSMGSDCGVVDICGGYVMAIGGSGEYGLGGGAGIGGGSAAAGVGGSGGIIVISGGEVVAEGKSGGAGIGGGYGGSVGAVLIYGEDTVVSAKNGGSGAEDIGVGADGNGGNVFVILPSDQLTMFDGSVVVNEVTFSADPLTVSGVVTVVLPAPFNVAPFVVDNIKLMTGLGSVTDGEEKVFHVLTTFTTEPITFSLKGYVNISPVTNVAHILKGLQGVVVPFAQTEVNGKVFHVYPDSTFDVEFLNDYDLLVAGTSDLSILYKTEYKVSKIIVEQYCTVRYHPGTYGIGAGFDELVLVGSDYTIRRFNDPAIGMATMSPYYILCIGVLIHSVRVLVIMEVVVTLLILI